LIYRALGRFCFGLSERFDPFRPSQNALVASCVNELAMSLSVGKDLITFDAVAAFPGDQKKPCRYRARSRLDALWSVMAFPKKMLSDATIFYPNSDLRRSAAGL
jgi:hypothetical protein